MSRSHGHSADIALAALLDALAPVLITLDITPSRLAQMARASFVKASARKAQMKSSGRPHFARIAALTGLSRSEVKRLISSNYKIECSDPDNSPRALRVLHGWRNSPTYSKSGTPKPLKIVGRSPSFQSLCKTYSGDIPYKVILDDLEGRRSIVVSRKHNRVAVTSSSKKGTHNTKDYTALTFAASFLGEAFGHDLILVRRREKIATSRDLPDGYVESAVANRISDLLDQLPQLYTRRNASKRNILNVFALVSRNQQKR